MSVMENILVKINLGFYNSTFSIKWLWFMSTELGTIWKESPVDKFKAFSYREYRLAWNLRQSSLCTGQDMISGPHEYKAAVVIISSLVPGQLRSHTELYTTVTYTHHGNTPAATHTETFLFGKVWIFIRYNGYGPCNSEAMSFCILPT
jgi:hypothetical protein